MNMNNMFNQNIMFMNMMNMFNQMKNNNNNNNNYKRNNINKEKPPEERYQRSEKQIIVNDENSIGNELININLYASSGLKVMITISKCKTIKDLFKLYVRRIEISESLIGKEIIFIFNAETLSLNDNRLNMQIILKHYFKKILNKLLFNKFFNNFNTNSFFLYYEI